jgi:MATE family multidrug resistance protein
VEHHGRQALAISNTMRNIFGLFGVFVWAFGSTTNAMVSNIIGQGMESRVRVLVGRILRWSMGIAGLIVVLVNVFPRAFLTIYGQDSDFMVAAIPVLRVVSLALFIMSFAVIWLNAVTGTGNTKVNLLIEFVTIVFYSVYVYLVLEVWQCSLVVGWMSEWLYWGCMFTMAYFYMRSGKWKGKVI